MPPRVIRSASTKFGSGTLMRRIALPSACCAIENVIVSPCELMPPAFTEMPPGAAGWVEMRSWLTSVKA